MTDESGARGGTHLYPARNEAHLYLLALGDLDENFARRVLPLLDDGELARHERIRYPGPRHEYVATRAIARLTLAAYEGRDPRTLRFVANEYGRPRLADTMASPLHFNLTNTRGLVACIIGVHDEIGVDAEFIHRKSRTVEIADRFFSKREVADLHDVPKHAQRRTFFRYWTLKEAYIKARGMGLALPLSDFSFALADERITISFGPRIVDEARTWRFEHVTYGEEHLVSTAVRSPDAGRVRVDLRTVDPTRDWGPLLARHGM